MVWLGFMRVMLRFSASWLGTMLTPDNLSRLATLTRMCLEDRVVLLAWLRFWTELSSQLAVSETQRANLQQTLRRAFESTPKDEPLPTRTQASTVDEQVLEAACGSLPPSLLIRLMDVTTPSTSMPHMFGTPPPNLSQQIIETMHALASAPDDDYTRSS